MHTAKRWKAACAVARRPPSATNVSGMQKSPCTCNWRIYSMTVMFGAMNDRQALEVRLRRCETANGVRHQSLRHAESRPAQPNAVNLDLETFLELIEPDGLTSS